MNQPTAPDNLRAMREAAGLFLTKAARDLDCDQGSLSRYERGIDRTPLMLAERMAKVYGVSVEQVVKAARVTWESAQGNTPRRRRKREGKAAAS